MASRTISNGFCYGKTDRPGVLNEGQYAVVGGKKKCEFAIPAIVAESNWPFTVSQMFPSFKRHCEGDAPTEIQSAEVLVSEFCQPETLADAGIEESSMMRKKYFKNHLLCLRKR